MSLEEASKHLDLAREQFDAACTDWWEPADAGSCVSNVFYAYENLVVAVAESHNLRWKKNHYDKAALATELHKQKILSKDLGDEILRLNNLRKDVHYGEPGFELGEEDLESLVSDLEGIVNEVESMISRMVQAADNE